ncbi:GNAT family N-acetyltransferase [Teredinibacter purpureus]|uniref:GNAT family N-acetyltransferase n=1 Tax=Teredinibacter purpureus TaxID=2731756 RepID=UPI0005F88973|nr:N-acetyltransferase [Teredinibacter purpureus]
MNVLLEPMKEADYSLFIEAAVAGYAQEGVDAGRWTVNESIKKSRAETMSNLPQGLETPGHYLFDIKTLSNDLSVGYLWAATEEKHGHQSMFVYDIAIKPECRRRGYAVAAFCELEIVSARMGIDSIGLHVFSANSAAQALYRKLGYEVTGVNMQKKLGA